MDKLQEARKIISEIDAEMAELFVRRMRASEQVAEYKKERGLPVFDAVREQEVLEKGSARVSDPVLREHYVRFLQNNMDVSKDYQRCILEGMKVAYSGSEGAFAFLAAREIFPTAQLAGFPDFAAAYEAVRLGECDCAVLPVENSSAGEVGQVTDMMFDGSLYVNGMYELAVKHDLLACRGAKMEDIRTVVSHPQALAQCEPYLRKKGWQTREYSNTALAAKLVGESGDTSLAAIASAKTAEVYDLAVLQENIHQSGSNTTRFAVFSRTENETLGKALGDHFILLFATGNQAGSLARAIEIIGRHGFNMRTLRSRPRKDILWEYYFYVELSGDLRGEEGKAMLAELASVCERVRVAGSFQAHCRIGEGE